MRKYQAAVDAGVAKLDAFFGTGWRKHLACSKDELDLGSPFHCVLGIQFDNFFDGIQKLGLRYDPNSRDDSDLVAHGFVADFGGLQVNHCNAGEHFRNEYQELTKEWLLRLDEPVEAEHGTVN